MFKIKIFLSFTSVIILSLVFRGMYLMSRDQAPALLENKLSRKKVDTSLVQKENLPIIDSQYKSYRYFIKKNMCMIEFIVKHSVLSYGKTLEIYQGAVDKDCLVKLGEVKENTIIIFSKIFKEWSKYELSKVYLSSLKPFGLLDEKNEQEVSTKVFHDFNLEQKNNFIKELNNNSLVKETIEFFIRFGFFSEIIKVEDKFYVFDMSIIAQEAL